MAKGVVDDIFNVSGKIPTNDKFWELAKDELVSENGITPKFSRIIGEQYFRPLNTPQTPFYNVFAGKEAIKAGKGWIEDAICRTKSKKFNPKATAQDALGFYDSEGIQKVYEVDYQGWRPISLPSDLESIEMFIKENGPGKLNDLLVANEVEGHQLDIDSAIAKKLISNTKAEVEVVPTDYQAIEQTMRLIATRMRGDTYHYNALTPEENGKVWTHAKKVLAFMPEELWNEIRSSHASLPSPDQLIQNVEVIPCPNDLPAPITTGELAEGGSEGMAWTVEPLAKDKAKPLIYMCSADICEYRPVVGSYKMKLQENGAGDFTNAHLVYKGAIAMRPWENAVRIIPTLGKSAKV